MSVERKEKGSGNFLSFILSVVFFLIVGYMFHHLQVFETEIRDLDDITWFEFVILSLAVFRLTRLLVYDKVAQWVRDLFLITKEEVDADKHVIYVVRYKHTDGFNRLFADLLSCPWCVGVWAAAAAVIIYFSFPWTWPFWFLMAIAGVASLIQITINLVGWSAEYGKIRVNELDHDVERP